MSSLHTPLYSAACNPPRAAKRHRTLSRSLEPSSTRRLLPNPVPDAVDTEGLDEDNKADSDYEESLVTPPSAVAALKGRGKQKNLSRSTRESLRKQNHSRIEKARRTKINDALDTLRTLVPDEYRTRCKEDDGEEDEKRSGRNKEPQKEFKLEILVRTVAYLKDLIAKVQELEELDGDNVHSERNSLKRKREDDGEEHTHTPIESKDGCAQTDVVVEDVEMDSKVARPMPPLPSISTWLLVDPNKRPICETPSQLPSPPLSETSSRSLQSSSTNCPTLILPSPMSTSVNRSQPSSPTFSSLQGQLHSPEDESAASLLLHMKSSTKKKVQTPGSILGLDVGRR